MEYRPEWVREATDNPDTVERFKLDLRCILHYVCRPLNPPCGFACISLHVGKCRRRRLCTAMTECVVSRRPCGTTHQDNTHSVCYVICILCRYGDTKNKFNGLDSLISVLARCLRSNIAIIERVALKRTCRYRRYELS